MTGKPIPQPGVQPSNVLILQDCSDPGALVRILPRAQRHLRVPPSVLSVSPFERGKHHIGFAVATTVAEAHHDPVKAEGPVILLCNSAPRASGATKNAEGCEFVYARLPGNHHYFGTFGVELAHVAPWLQPEDLWLLDIPRNGTPFRSRFLADAAGRWQRGDKSVLVEPVELERIPSIDPLSVRERDAQGNLKIGITSDHALFNGVAFGRRLLVTINGIRQHVVYAEGIGARGSKGDLILAAGSTTHTLDGPQRNFIDIYCNEGHAASHWANPAIRRPDNGHWPDPGDAITLEWAA